MTQQVHWLAATRVFDCACSRVDASTLTLHVGALAGPSPPIWNGSLTRARTSAFGLGPKVGSVVAAPEGTDPIPRGRGGLQ